MEAKPELNSELESFRQQWKSELQTKKPDEKTRKRTPKKAAASSSTSTNVSRTEAAAAPSSSSKAAKQTRTDEDEDHVKAQVFDGPSSTFESGQSLVHPENADMGEPVSALDHYEAAVEKEAIGNLGDSLRLYRKAFRLDHRVDMAYRKKHFAAQWQKPAAPSSSQPRPDQPGAAGGTTAAAAVTPAPSQEHQPQSLNDLIASFSGLAVCPAPPPVEGDPAPPCPISELPQEILSHVLSEVAVADVGDFVRLSLVCRRFAYLAATESQIWRRVVTGPEFGFAGMHYHWQRGISWQPLEESDEEELQQQQQQQQAAQQAEDGELVSMEELRTRRRDESLATTVELLPAYSGSWQHMFRHRPRIRFNGCYISTVNYIRSGQASANQVTWASPVHIVTYYRYLRFFRDGTLISLLTTSEPGDVVHHMTRELLRVHARGDAAHLPSVVMQNGLRGRWRLSSAALDHPDDDDTVPLPLKETEGDVMIETEGVGEKYTYRMDLSLRSSGKGARNNKLAWRAFYSYNKLTDDLAEFSLKNDKPFFFSRVRSYGVRGE